MQIQEGKVTITIPQKKKIVTKKDKVFYNPEMRYNRDISVQALQIFQKSRDKPLTICDALSATGIRGIRYAKEVKGIKKVIFNDLNPSAIKLIKQNVKLNKIKNYEIHQKDVNALLSELKGQLDFVDIDPFGSPIDFLDSAARSLYKNSLLGVTATDTAPLAGTCPKTCLRRYRAKPLKCDIKHEIGIRILIGVITKELAKYDKSFKPVISLSKLHYYRVVGLVKYSKTETDKSIGDMGYILYCHKCGNRKLSKELNPKCDHCKANFDYAGPLWIGKLFEHKYYQHEEAKLNYLFYDIHTVAKKHKLSMIKTQELVDRLRKKGFSASKTHFIPTGVRTDASLKDLKSLWVRSK